TMIDGDLHDIVMSRHLRAVLRRQFICGAEAESAAVEIDHHWALAAQARRPDVELEHVFALPTVVPILNERLLDGCPWMWVLRAVGAVNERRPLVLPRSGRLGGKPTILTRRCLPVRNTLEDEHTVVEVAAHFAVLCLGDRRSRRRDAAGAATNSRLLGVVGRSCIARRRHAQSRSRRKNERLAAS